MSSREDFAHFSEVEEQESCRGHETPVWQLVATLMCGTVVLLLVGGLIAVRRNIPPSLVNMANDPISAPFAISAVNALQAAHMLMALSLFYRSRSRCPRWGRAQLALAVATHAAFLLVLFALPFVGWDRDWASAVPVYTWAAWEGAVLVVLARVYRHRLQWERDYLLGNVAAFVVFCIGAVLYTVFRIVQLPLVFFISECVMGLSVIVFMVLLIVHTKRVHFSMQVLASAPAPTGGSIESADESGRDQYNE